MGFNKEKRQATPMGAAGWLKGFLLTYPLYKSSNFFHRGRHTSLPTGF